MNSMNIPSLYSWALFNKYVLNYYKVELKSKHSAYTAT